MLTPQLVKKVVSFFCKMKALIQLRSLYVLQKAIQSLKSRRLNQRREAMRCTRTLEKKMVGR